MTVKTPFILVNFKAYREASGKNALKLAKIAEEVSKETGVCIGVAVQATDIAIIAKEVSIPVFAQHIDPIQPGRFTGHILPEAVKEAGATGTLINHSEKRMKLPDIEIAIERSKEVKLFSLVCADTAEAAAKIASFGPDSIAIEPPELIATGIAVSKAKPDIVMDVVKSVRSINEGIVVLCGAGIVQGEDVKAALKLGTEGILVSSGVVLSPDPRKVLLELASSAKV